MIIRFQVLGRVARAVHKGYLWFARLASEQLPEWARAAIAIYGSLLAW